MAPPETRKIRLRQDRTAELWRNLWASLDAEGNLHLEGQDLGPSAGHDGEYEWFETIRADHVPALLELLGIDAGADLLDELEARYSGPRSYDFERALGESAIPVERFTY